MHDHLSPEVAKALQLTTAERIEFCQTDRWIGYTKAQQIVKQLDDLLVYPKSLRMPNLLLVGDSDNGKSSILQHFVRRHPIVKREDGTPGPRVLWFSMPATPNESNFWSEMLWSLNIQHRDRDTPDKKSRQAFDALEYASVRMLAIDEFNHVANADKNSGRLLAAIKNLSSALRIPIVAAGTPSAPHTLRSDPQMHSRFEIARLDRWKLDKEYLRFLASYETMLPLAEPSNLASRELAPEIFKRAGLSSTIGGTVKLLKAASSHALTIGREKIDMHVLSSMNYVPSGE
jgi:hypothetical protein